MNLWFCFCVNDLKIYCWQYNKDSPYRDVHWSKLFFFYIFAQEDNKHTELFSKKKITHKIFCRYLTCKKKERKI